MANNRPYIEVDEYIRISDTESEGAHEEVTKSPVKSEPHYDDAIMNDEIDLSDLSNDVDNSNAHPAMDLFEDLQTNAAFEEDFDRFHDNFSVDAQSDKVQNGSSEEVSLPKSPDMFRAGETGTVDQAEQILIVSPGTAAFDFSEEATNHSQAVAAHDDHHSNTEEDEELAPSLESMLSKQRMLVSTPKKNRNPPGNNASDGDPGLFDPRVPLEAWRRQQTAALEVFDKTNNYASDAPDGIDSNVDEDDSWMATVGTISDDETKEAAETFKRQKRAYATKKTKGKATMQDDVEWTKIERAEKCRLEKLRKALATANANKFAMDDTVNDDDDDPDSLFLPDRPTGSGRAKRSSRDDDDEENGNYEALVRTKKSKSSKGRGRKRQDLYADEIRAAIPKGTGLDKPKKRGRARPSDSGRMRSSKTASDRISKSGKKGKKKKKKKKHGPVMLNVGSLWTSDPVRDAQANEGQGSIPTFTSKNKDLALKELIASIPGAKAPGSSANADRNAIIEATRKFCSKNMRSNGLGGWQLKGMSSSLFHHQLLGAGWMRDRENSTTRPHGGIVADEMGFGKTIQMITNILDDKDVARTEQARTTLIVVTPALVPQWIAEFRKHCEDKSLPRILRWDARSKLESTDIISDLRGYDCIVTTYQEVHRSYPDDDPPKSLTTESAMNAWWKEHFTNNAGPLHKIRFRRIVLDEAQQIKNPDGKISKAVRALTGHYRWCISGTPIQNRVEELFAFFDFLRCPHTGNFDLFKQNYCEGRTDHTLAINPERLSFMLQGIMLRRTHAEKLFSRPIVTLPGIDHDTQFVDFNEVERSIYAFVKHKFIERINNFSAHGTLQTQYRSILTMMHRLRMLTGHILLLQSTLKECLHGEDIESLWRLTAHEDGNGERPLMNTLIELRQLIKARRVAKASTEKPTEDDIRTALRNLDPDTEIETGGKFALTFTFRKFLQALRNHGSWAELHERSLCHKCRNVPEDPWVTACLHIYCKECLELMAHEAAAKEKENSNCLECGEEFKTTSPCEGLQELGWDAHFRDRRDSATKKSKKSKKTTKARKGRSQRTSETPDDSDSEDVEDVDWIGMKGDLLPSAKTTAAKAQILAWLEASPNEKIVIFTQWIDMIRILKKMCNMEGWGHVEYHGKMHLDSRGRSLKLFAEEPSCKIMLCSLKAGGVGLNLTSASKVLILDLYWNSSVERQAFCRCFRIGQSKKVEIIRYVVRDTIDEDLVTMQERKNTEIDSVMGEEARKNCASLDQLLELFGPIKDDENGSGFIYVEDEAEESSDGDSDEDRAMEKRIPRRPR